MMNLRAKIASVIAALRDDVSASAINEAVALAHKSHAVESLLDAGHINADDATLTAARKLADVDADALTRLLTAQRPVPAQIPTSRIDPNTPTDATQAAILAHMEANKVPYHEAAVAISEGGSIQ
jgi:hypothetical protein